MTGENWRKEARARLSVTTEGPWGERAIYWLLRYASKNDGPWNDTPSGEVGDGDLPNMSDASFIAHARTDLPRALDLLDELEAWLRNELCLACGGAGAFEVIHPTQGVQEQNCTACGGAGTEWSRFQRRKKA